MYIPVLASLNRDPAGRAAPASPVKGMIMWRPAADPSRAKTAMTTARVFAVHTILEVAVAAPNGTTHPINGFFYIEFKTKSVKFRTIFHNENSKKNPN
jgi:hypothetical protein